MKKYVFLSSLFVILFSACSTKEVFEPKVLAKKWDRYENLDKTIIDTSSNVALLDDSNILTQKDELDVNIDLNTSHRLISQSGDWIISASIDGDVALTSKSDKKIQEKFELKKTVAGASVNNKELAVLFADNEMAIYDVDSKALLFKEQGVKFLAADSRIVNPYFMKDLVLFATLDGKVIIVNNTLKKKLRTVIVSTEENFNNVISLNVVDNKIIAVTGYNILSLSQKEVRSKHEIRNIVYDEMGIFISTKQGEVISLTPDLQVNSKVKFPFAHFYGMIEKNDKLYILEKEGYMIVLDKKTFDYTVHEVDFDDGFVFTTENNFYVNDAKILVE